MAAAFFSSNYSAFLLFVARSAFGGLAGATFILSHRKYVLFMRKNKRISNIIKKK